MVQPGLALPSGVSVEDVEDAQLLLDHMHSLNAAWAGRLLPGDAAPGLSEREAARTPSASTYLWCPACYHVVYFDFDQNIFENKVLLFKR